MDSLQAYIRQAARKEAMRVADSVAQVVHSARRGSFVGKSYHGPTGDDINPALPIIRNIP